jgi:hypothetical protein
MMMRTGDVVVLGEHFEHQGFKWTNYRLVKVMVTYNAGMDLLSYLPFTGGRVLRPNKHHQIFGTGLFTAEAQRAWNRTNHFYDFSSVSSIFNAIRGFAIPKPKAA